MGMTDGFDDRQPQTRANIAAVWQDPVKAVENPLMMAGIDADASILHGDEALFVLHACLDRDLTAVRRVFDGIVQQVDQHLLQPVAIAGHNHGWPAGPVQRDLLFDRHQVHLIHGLDGEACRSTWRVPACPTGFPSATG